MYSSNISSPWILMTVRLNSITITNRELHCSNKQRRKEGWLELDPTSEKVSSLINLGYFHAYHPSKTAITLNAQIPLATKRISLISGFNSAFESVKNLVKPLVGYGDDGGERRFDINERTKVYFDIEVDGVYEGRVNLELFDEIVPRTTENFRQLCTRKQLGSRTQDIKKTKCSNDIVTKLSR